MKPREVARVFLLKTRTSTPSLADMLGTLAPRVAATAIVLTLGFPVVVDAQESIPTIRAHSKIVTIVDGIHLKEDYWYIMPEREPDIYYVEIPRLPHTVTFATDMDSIAIPVTYGSRYSFVIELDNGVRALTEVRAEYRDLLPYRRISSVPTEGPDEIPFTLGDNDKIYVQGRINGSDLLNFQVDLGAGGSIIKESSVPKVDMTFDQTITLRNSDGENVVPASSANRLDIAGLTWDNVPFAVADNMTRREDAIVGNSLFRDRILEIDYGRMVIKVHETLPVLSGEWRRQDIYLDGGTVPFIRGTLSVDEEVAEGWFLFDTGAYTSILHSERLSPASKFGGELRRLLGTFGVRPEEVSLTIGGTTIAGPNYSVRRFDGNTSSLGVLGNDILKRFDVVLDNRNGVVWLRPNSHTQAGFRNPERMVVRIAALLILASGVAAAWRWGFSR